MIPRNMKDFLVQQYIETFAREKGDKIAVMDEKNKIAYRELDLVSNQLAHCLNDKGVSRQDCVIFCIQRSVNCLIALLGILKADAVYVPIDHKISPERIRKIVEDCSPSALICDESTIFAIISFLKSFELDIPVISLSSEEVHKESFPQISYREQILSYSEKTPEYGNCDNDTAYILYTSGSTGAPKGVMISHRNIHCYIEWAVEFFQISENDRILSTAPFHFDMSVFDIFCSLKAGATLCIASEKMLLFPQSLLQFMEKEGVTVWKGISSLLMYIERAGILDKVRLPELRVIAFGGEALPIKYLIPWMKAFPDKKFFNAYGPTEATGISLCYAVDTLPEDLRKRIPIGKPCKETDVFLLDDQGCCVEPGRVGELCIGGTCLSKGYLNDPEKTRLSFIDNPIAGNSEEKIYRTGDLAVLREDGNYEFIARKDNQIKHMGYRIELCEIEHALGAIRAIRDAAVLLVKSEHKGFNELIAYYEAEEDIALTIIISELQKHLPYYMVPKQFVRISNIPRNDRGKICRETLRQHGFPIEDSEGVVT